MTYTFNRPAFPATRMRRIRKNELMWTYWFGAATCGLGAYSRRAASD